MSTPVVLVLAMAANGVIGDRGTIPWRIPDDMRHFKALTMGKPVIMGRKTWESLPRKPLPGRTNIVVTRNFDFAAPGAKQAHSFEEAIAMAQGEGAPEIAIIGGAEIYRAALPLAQKIYLTEVHAPFEGDAAMAPFEPRQWGEMNRVDGRTPEGLAYSFVTLTRR